MWIVADWIVAASKPGNLLTSCHSLHNLLLELIGVIGSRHGFPSVCLFDMCEKTELGSFLLVSIDDIIDLYGCNMNQTGLTSD